MNYVVVTDNHCEFGPPIGSFTSETMARDWISKRQAEERAKEGGYAVRGYFIFPMVPNEPEHDLKHIWILKDGSTWNGDV